MKTLDKICKVLFLVIFLLVLVEVFHFIPMKNKKIERAKIELKRAQKSLDSIRTQRSKDADFNAALKAQEAQFKKIKN